MKEILIACEMLRDELELAMEKTGLHPETVWMEKGLHDEPQKLRNILQAKIDEVAPEYPLILMGMAYCGGAMEGIGSDSATVVVPHFDDCIRMLLSTEHGCQNAADCHCLYYTRQWITSEHHITRDLERYKEEYDEETAVDLMQMMLVNYTGLRMIDTGAYPLADYRVKAMQDAETLGLDYGEQPGSIRILEKLLRHEFDEEFCIIEPGNRMTQSRFLNLK